MPTEERTRLAPRFLFKTMIFLAVTVVLGTWFYLDAAVFYPRRGASFADWAKWQYLQACQGSTAQQLPLSRWQAIPSVTDPAAELADLNSRGAEKQALSEVDHAKLRWLSGLVVIGRLRPAETNIPDPPAALATLSTLWQGRNAPTPLSPWDIPVQWLLAGVCAIVSLWIVVLFARAGRLRYRWVPPEHRLILPDGSSIVPDDLAEVDKRKWEKFLVFLKIKPQHERHGGKELRLDLYRYSPLEAWVLDMEKTAFPGEPPPSPPPEAPGDPSEPAAAVDADENTP